MILVLNFGSQFAHLIARRVRDMGVRAEILPFDAKAFWAIIKLAIFASTFAFILFTYSVRNIGINKSNIFINVIPVFVAVIAYVVLGDKLNFHQR